MGYGAGLGQSIAFHQPSPGELLEALLHLNWERAGATDANLDAGYPVVAYVGDLVDGCIEDGNAREHSGLVSADGF